MNSIAIDLPLDIGISERHLTQSVNSSIGSCLYSPVSRQVVSHIKYLNDPSNNNISCISPTQERMMRTDFYNSPASPQ